MQIDKSNNNNTNNTNNTKKIIINIIVMTFLGSLVGMACKTFGIPVPHSNDDVVPQEDMTADLPPASPEFRSEEDQKIMNDLNDLEKIVKKDLGHYKGYGGHFNSFSWRSLLKTITEDYCVMMEAVENKDCRNRFAEILRLFLKEEGIYAWVKSKGNLESFIEEGEFISFLALLNKAFKSFDVTEEVKEAYSSFVHAIYDRRLRQINDASSEMISIMRGYGSYGGNDFVKSKAHFGRLDPSYVPMTDQLIRQASLLVDCSNTKDPAIMEINVVVLAIQQYYETCQDLIFTGIMKFEDYQNIKKNKKEGSMDYYFLRKHDEYAEHFLHPSGELLTWFCQDHMSTKDSISFLNKIRTVCGETVWFDRLWKTFFDKYEYDKLFQYLYRSYKNKDEYQEIFTLDNYINFITSCHGKRWYSIVKHQLKDEGDKEVALRFYERISEEKLAKFLKESYDRLQEIFELCGLDFRLKVVELIFREKILARIYELLGTEHDYKKDKEDYFVDPVFAFNHLADLRNFSHVSTNIDALVGLAKIYLENDDANALKFLDVFLESVLHRVYNSSEYSLRIEELLQKPKNHWISKLAFFVLLEKYKTSSSEEIEWENTDLSLLRVNTLNSIVLHNPQLRKILLEEQTKFKVIPSLLAPEVAVSHYHDTMIDLSISPQQRFTAFNQLINALESGGSSITALGDQVPSDLKEYAELLIRTRKLFANRRKAGPEKHAEIFESLAALRKFLDSHSIEWNFDVYFRDFVTGSRPGSSHDFDGYNYNYFQMVRKTEAGEYVCTKKTYIIDETKYGIIAMWAGHDKAYYLLDDEGYPRSFVQVPERGEYDHHKTFIEKEGKGPIPYSLLCWHYGTCVYLNLETGYVFSVDFECPEDFGEKHNRYLIGYVFKDGELLGKYFGNKYYKLEFEFGQKEKENCLKKKYTYYCLTITIKDMVMYIKHGNNGNGVTFLGDKIITSNNQFSEWYYVLNASTLDFELKENGKKREYSPKHYEKYEDAFMAMASDYDYATKKYKHLLHIYYVDSDNKCQEVIIKTDEYDDLNICKVFSLKQDGDRHIYILGPDGKGQIFSLEQKKFIKRVEFSLQPEDSKRDIHDGFFEVAKDSKGELWFEDRHFGHKYYRLSDGSKFEGTQTLSEGEHYDFITLKF